MIADKYDKRMTDELLSLTQRVLDNSRIDPSLYAKYDVKRGLRDLNGNGVLTGLTEISEIRAKTLVDGELTPCAGRLFYRGINVEDLVGGCMTEKRFGFEETIYLLLFGQLPNAKQLKSFNKLLGNYRSLPKSFVRDFIMKAPGNDLMNILARCVLALYAYDTNADDTSIENVLRQCLQLIAVFPMLAVYGYQAFNYYHAGNSLFLHPVQKKLSTAENILYMLRADSKYTELEARVLDMALIIHAEHGGGNNSTFTTHVVSSSGTDTYSAIAAALGSLKGPKHGGANIKVVEMFDDMKKQVRDWNDDDEISCYLNKLLDKQAFDNKGLIYGIGHAIYSVSDPRASIFRGFVEELSAEKGRSDEFKLYRRVEQLAPEIVSAKRKMYKGVSANVDFYSGFAYQLLDLPKELYTPIFAVARIAGWSAHRLEELINAGKIIRPAYMHVGTEKEYLPLNER